MSFRQWKTGRIVAAGLVALVAFAVIIALADMAASARMRDDFDRERLALISAAQVPDGARGDSAAPEALPLPVQRYLEVTGTTTGAAFRTAFVEQHGELRQGPGQPVMPFVAEQVYSVSPAAFLWFARARMAGVLSLVVRDRYTDGTGEMLVKAFGAYTVVRGVGAEIDQGAALRFWGELLAFPETVLDPRLRWEQIDERNARLWIGDGAQRLHAVVTFDDAGFLREFRTDRYRDVKGEGVLTDWSGRMSGWRRFGDRWFPVSWVSVWHLPEGDLTAVTMTITSVRVE